MLIAGRAKPGLGQRRLPIARRRRATAVGQQAHVQAALFEAQVVDVADHERQAAAGYLQQAAKALGGVGGGAGLAGGQLLAGPAARG